MPNRDTSQTHHQTEQNGAHGGDAGSPEDTGFSAGARARGGMPFSLFTSDQHLDAILNLNESPVLKAFRHGVMLVMPLLLAAAVAILINNFPLTVYQSFMAETFGPGWKVPGATLYNCTIEILALVTCLTLSDSLVFLHNTRSPEFNTLPIMGIMTSFVCLFIMLGPQMSAQGMLLPWAGIRGLFGALVVTFIACGVFLRLCRVRRLRLSAFTEGADPILPHMFDVLLPVLLTVLFFICFREGLMFFGIKSIQGAFYESIRSVFTNMHDGFATGALYAFLVQLCWFFGIHGADLLDPITHDVLIRSLELNSMAMNAGEAPSHIITKYLFDVYIFMGGSGATLGLIIAIFIKSRDQGTRRIAGLSFVPGIFHINELLVFGLPVVLNPAFLIPFLIVPLVLLCISYVSILVGIAPLPVYQVDWITPPGINALISTGSWKGVALQTFNLIVATLIYMPFVGLADRAKVVDRKKSFRKLVSIAESGLRGPHGKRCVDLPGSLGALARALANDMSTSLKGADGSIRLHYQPRVNMVEKRVPGVEALLRWEHVFYGTVPPVLTLAIAEDVGLTKRLDDHVVTMAFEQQAQWRTHNIFTTINVNLSENQLKDPGFPALLDYLFGRHNLPGDSFLFEVRESLALMQDGKYLEALKAIHATGAGLGVDDFGKGYQAISQLKRLPLTELQIDHTLIQDISDNRFNQDVVGNIQEMCYKMGIKTSAEYIESHDQLEMLLELNFTTFQGFYFSEPVTAEECTRFIQSFAKNEE
ncbi:EAL domain-containing protein [Desulfovibrio sp. OttesenSCG-928-G15]|nr:EAL domain-containing protein [Desulfovibrio sp. OttesenSCG-928-G15]